MTRAESARRAHVTTSYVGRLEAGGAAPRIDLVDRLAEALGTKVADLLPETAPQDTPAVLRDQARAVLDGLLRTADRETPLMLCPCSRASPSRRRGGADTRAYRQSFALRSRATARVAARGAPDPRPGGLVCEPPGVGVAPAPASSSGAPGNGKGPAAWSLAPPAPVRVRTRRWRAVRRGSTAPA
jgi:transcriptional regulator with XRE-family HTH domain